ncbi:hypothetical protein [uncultured Dokdonia sp.]|uniref:hypothetical protein n=1 Tax=uncultured Dokdonia sp. TaxID=575653 RepID=UPI002633FD75|nr:hypothetical protein [uncultured Dokdonia sp.]
MSIIKKHYLKVANIADLEVKLPLLLHQIKEQQDNERLFNAYADNYEANVLQQQQQQKQQHYVYYNLWHLLTWIKAHSNTMLNGIPILNYLNKQVLSSQSGNFVLYQKEIIRGKHANLKFADVEVIHGFAHTEFHLIIKESGEMDGDPVIDLCTDTFDGIKTILDYIQLPNTKKILQKITKEYQSIISETRNINDLDVIYENLPNIVYGKLNDKVLLDDLKNMLAAGVSGKNAGKITLFNTNEELAIVNILKAMSGKALYDAINQDLGLLQKIYDELHGEHLKEAMNSIWIACIAYGEEAAEYDSCVVINSTKMANKAPLKLFTIQSTWDGGTSVNIYNETSENASARGMSVSVRSDPYNEIHPHPLDIITIISADGSTEMIAPAIIAHYLIKDQQLTEFWKIISFASHFAGIAGAIRALTVKGASILVRRLAIVELAKTGVDLVMQHPFIKQKLKEADAEWISDYWNILSVSYDMVMITTAFGPQILKFGPKAISKLEDLLHSFKSGPNTLELSKVELQRVISRLKELVKASKKAKVKKQEFNPEQHSEFIDNADNIPGKQKPKETVGQRKERLQQKRKRLEEIKTKEKIEEIKKQTLEQRKKELGTDPAKDYIEHEAEVGAAIEKRFGYLERSTKPDVEWVSLSGSYKGKTFDLIGLKKGISNFVPDDMKDFIKSLKDHFVKSDVVVLDYRYMNKPQIKNVEIFLKNENIIESDNFIKIWTNNDL